MSQAGRGVGCCPGGLRGVEPRLRITAGRARAVVEAAAGHPVEEPAVGVLHPEQPVKLPLHLVEQVGNSVAALRDVGVVAEGSRVQLVRPEQVKERGLQVRYVLVQVAGVEPAAKQVPRPAQGLASLAEPRGPVLVAAQVTAGVMPDTAVLLRDGRAASLVVKDPHRIA